VRGLLRIRLNALVMPFRQSQKGFRCQIPIRHHGGVDNHRF